MEERRELLLTSSSSSSSVVVGGCPLPPARPPGSVNRTGESDEGARSEVKSLPLLAHQASRTDVGIVVVLKGYTCWVASCSCSAASKVAALMRKSLEVLSFMYCIRLTWRQTSSHKPAAATKRTRFGNGIGSVVIMLFSLDDYVSSSSEVPLTSWKA